MKPSSKYLRPSSANVDMRKAQIDESAGMQSGVHSICVEQELYTRER